MRHSERICSKHRFREKSCAHERSIPTKRHPQFMSPHVTSCHLMSPHVTSCHLMSPHVTSCHLMSAQHSKPALQVPFSRRVLPRSHRAAAPGRPCRQSLAVVRTSGGAFYGILLDLAFSIYGRLQPRHRVHADGRWEPEMLATAFRHPGQWTDVGNFLKGVLHMVFRRCLRFPRIIRTLRMLPKEWS